MSDQPVTPASDVQPPEVSATPPAPSAKPDEHMIPKARLDEEIARRKEFESQLKKLSGQLEKGSEAQKQLESMAAQLEISEKRASFLEEAMRPEIECRNPGAAWTIAKANDLFDKRGAPDWKAIRTAAPELFGKQIANANAGAGTGQPPAKQNTMNDFIRSRGR